MVLFLATVLEQLDLALEHISKRDVLDARFGLMLTDNALELVLHQIAKDKSSHLKAFDFEQDNYPHRAAFDRAMGRSFEAKVKFARLEAKLGEETAHTFNIMHGFRNEVYHVGLQHEEILAALALFYFEVTCGYIGSYVPPWLGWSSSEKFTERARKYFHSGSFFSVRSDDFGNACLALAKECGHDSSETILVLAQHMDKVIDNQDTDLDIVAGGVYEGQQTTRDEAVIDSQTWRLAFLEEGHAFAEKHGWKGSDALQLVEWLRDNYPLKYRRDPIASWKKQAAKMHSHRNPHAALMDYHSFMAETANLREAIQETAGEIDAAIDAAIDRARGG